MGRKAKVVKIFNPEEDGKFLLEQFEKVKDAKTIRDSANDTLKYEKQIAIETTGLSTADFNMLFDLFQKQDKEEREEKTGELYDIYDRLVKIKNERHQPE